MTLSYAWVLVVLSHVCVPFQMILRLQSEVYGNSIGEKINFVKIPIIWDFPKCQVVFRL